MNWQNIQQPQVMAIAAVAVSAGVLGYMTQSSLLLGISVIAFIALLLALARPAPLKTPKLEREHGPIPAMATVHQNAQPYTPPDLAHSETDSAGLEGEARARVTLEQLPAGYYVIFDARLPHSDNTIDALIIGPTGIYVAATANWRGNFSLRNGNWFRMNGAKPVAIMAANPFERLGEAVPYIEHAIGSIVRQPYEQWLAAQETQQQARYGQSYSIVNGVVLLTHPDSRLSTDHTGYPTLRVSDLMHGIHEGYDLISPDLCARLFEQLTQG